MKGIKSYINIVYFLFIIGFKQKLVLEILNICKLNIYIVNYLRIKRINKLNQ